MANGAGVPGSVRLDGDHSAAAVLTGRGLDVSSVEHRVDH